MSEQIKRSYFIKELDKDKNNISSQKEYKNEKDFYKNLKKNRKKARASVITNDNLEKPVYFIRSKAVFSDGDSTLCIDSKGKLQRKNKYEILKGKDGNDKYIVKKDENNYHRYSTDGRLIDSIEKIKGTNNYNYCAYGDNGIEKIKTEITSAENIDKAIELTRGQIKIERKGLEDEYKIEEQLFNTTGVYPDGNTFVKRNDFFIKHSAFIKDLCIKNNIIEQNDKTYYTIDNLITKLSSKLIGKEEKNLKLSDLSVAKSYVLKELFEAYKYKVRVLGTKDSKDERITIENTDDIQKKYSGKKVEFEFFDKESGENLFLPTQANSMKFFNETNIFGVDSKTNKITIGGNIIDNKKQYTYYFVKPVGQPMYFFKKEMGGEFSNHSNFKLKEEEKTREVEAAGSIIVKDGKICNISNSSGHFKPKSESIETALAYIASKTKNCKIENLIHDNYKDKEGNYSITTNIQDAIELSNKTGKQLSECIEDKEVVKPLTKTNIMAINIKAARMKAKEASKGGLSI